MTNLPPLITFLKQAAQAAGAILREGYYAAGAIDFESKGVSDFVTHYGRAAENAIIDTICRAHPNVGFLVEETGATPARGGEITVIITLWTAPTTSCIGYPAFLFPSPHARLMRLPTG